MAASPHVKVRLSPSMLASLEFLAERDRTLTATIAADIVKMYVRNRLREEHLDAQAQDFYNARLAAGATAPADVPTRDASAATYDAATAERGR